MSFPVQCDDIMCPTTSVIQFSHLLATKFVKMQKSFKKIIRGITAVFYIVE